MNGKILMKMSRFGEAQTLSILRQAEASNDPGTPFRALFAEYRYLTSESAFGSVIRVIRNKRKFHTRLDVDCLSSDQEVACRVQRPGMKPCPSPDWPATWACRKEPFHVR
jgi:hypothetical protein